MTFDLEGMCVCVCATNFTSLSFFVSSGVGHKQTDTATDIPPNIVTNTAWTRHVDSKIINDKKWWTYHIWWIIIYNQQSILPFQALLFWPNEVLRDFCGIWHNRHYCQFLISVLPTFKFGGKKLYYWSLNFLLKFYANYNWLVSNISTLTWT